MPFPLREVSPSSSPVLGRVFKGAEPESYPVNGINHGRLRWCGGSNPLAKGWFSRTPKWAWFAGMNANRPTSKGITSNPAQASPT
jgi:hypothetical protein